MKHVDKNSVKHFGVNALLSLLLGVFGVGIGIGASLTKEWCDLTFYGHWCWWDILFDFLGMAVGGVTNSLLLLWAFGVI